MTRAAPQPDKLGSITFAIGNHQIGDHHECHEWEGERNFVRTPSSALRERMTNVIPRFLAAFFLGYLTYVICYVAFIFMLLIGSEWRLSEIVWLNLNGVYGIGAGLLTAWFLLRLSNKVIGYLILKTLIGDMQHHCNLQELG